MQKDLMVMHEHCSQCLRWGLAGRDKSSVKMIFGNGIFCGGTFLSLLYMQDTCHIGLDEHHLLLMEDWPGYFGVYMWPSLKDEFLAYVYSKTEVECDERYLKLRWLVKHKAHWLNYVEKEIHAHKHLFVRCCIAAISGTNCLLFFYVVSLELYVAIPQRPTRYFSFCCHFDNSWDT